MHTYIFPISSSINKSSSVHFCEFFCTKLVNNLFVVIHRGTLVLDCNGYIVLSSNNVITGEILMKQRMSWDLLFKEDKYIIDQIKVIQTNFSKGEICVDSGSCERVEELQRCARELQLYHRKCILIRGTALFRHNIDDERIIWTKTVRKV